MGKQMLDSIYLKLGITEMDDMAEGIKALVDAAVLRQGRASASTARRTAATRRRSMILRHPDVVRRRVGVVAADRLVPLRHDLHRAVHVDSAGEQGRLRRRQRDELREEPARAGCCIYYGTADNNVHPNNSMQLIQALQQAGKSFEVQVGPDQGHSGVNNAAHDGVLHREPRHASGAADGAEQSWGIIEKMTTRMRATLGHSRRGGSGGHARHVVLAGRGCTKARECAAISAR